MTTEFELPAGNNDEEVLDALFGDESDIDESDFGEMEDEVEEKPTHEPKPDTTPAPQPQNDNSAELEYYREKNKILTSQLEEVGLNPEMTDRERLEKLAAGGIESEYAQELIDTFTGTMSETGAKSLVTDLVEQARLQRPDVKRDDEHPVAYELRVNKELSQLNTWRSSNDPRFQKAVELDEKLRNDQKFAQMSDTERFKIVQDMVAKGQTSLTEQAAVTQTDQVNYADPNSFDTMSSDAIEMELEKYADFL